MEESRSMQMPSLDADNSKGFLVYIPCHTDFEMAKIQAVNLRSQFQLLDNQQRSYIKRLSIVISVNGVKLSEHQLESLESV
jgi:hypothetical protein